jgi:hypothetical protein
MLELLASDFRPLVQDYLSWFLIVAAFIWGSGPERAVAATWLFAFKFLGFLDEALTGSGSLLTAIDPFLASKDVIAGVFWISIALYANRNYTLWIAGFQIIAMAAHLVRGLVESISPIAYAVMVIAPGWFQLLLLGIGLTRHILRKRKYGPYRDWRVFRDWGQPSRWREFRNRILALLGHDFFAKKDKA